MIKTTSVKFSILCDDRLAAPLFSEHGFSVIVEKDQDPPIVFDTGSSDVFIKNAEILGKDLTKVEKIIISHGHYDHAGGLRYLSKFGKKFKVYVRQEIFTPKYSDERFIGLDWKDLRGSFEFATITQKVTEITRGVYAFGPAEMKNDFEQPDTYFYILKDGQKIKDFFDDELSLVIDEDDGIVLITGCAHRGIVNIVEDATKTFGKKIKVLIGGFHLYKSPLSKIEKTLNALKAFGIKRIMPYHCTGDQAIQIINSFKM